MAIGTFTVDVELLRELGERLVGQPHVAVVELVKNAYDADAHNVEVQIGSDVITVTDDGHGIVEQDFLSRWLRIGSTHKQKERYSRDLRRPLTGQKGVGRLAVQFLGRTLALETVPKGAASGLEARINWDDALRENQLTEVKVEYNPLPADGRAFAAGQPHGVRLTIGRVGTPVLRDLSPTKLAARLWTLQPPRNAAHESQAFLVRVLDASGRVVAGFDEAMEAHLRQWHARVRGRLETKCPGDVGTLQVAVEFDDRTRVEFSRSIEACWIRAARFDVAVYSPQGRLKRDVRVQDFRDYLDEYGGVRLFDAGFQLPFYGERESDWLGIERDHAHRLSASKLLPADLQLPRGMNYLPTTSRLLGNVEVDTAAEARWVAESVAPQARAEHPPLAIAITRDRLILNRPYVQLRDAVRAAIDFYAVKEASRELDRKQRAAARAPLQSARSAIAAMKVRVADVAARLPRETAHDFQRGLDDVLEATRRVEEVQQVEAAVLGTLATAGLLALSQQHEMAKQITLLEDVLTSARAASADTRQTAWTDRLEAWIERARRTHRLFASYLEPDNRTHRVRLPVRKTVVAVIDSVEPLLRGVPIDAESLPPDELLPAAALAEWTAILQNVLLNAVNAIVTSGAAGVIRVSYRVAPRKRSLRVEDTGVGIDLDMADRYFRAFERALPGHAGRDAALGGSGLGLTIVRIVANRIGCHATFVEPAEGYATAFELAWEE